MKYSMNWELDSVFSGGSASPQLKERMDKLEQEASALLQRIKKYHFNKEDITALAKIIREQASVQNGFTQCNCFLTALNSADVNDAKAKVLQGDLFSLLPEIQLADTLLAKKLAEISEEDWQAVCQTEGLKETAFRLTEIRRDGARKLSENEENIISTLSLDGLKAWSSHYDTVVAGIQIPFVNEAGAEEILSAGQAYNLMMGHPDKNVRAELFKKWEHAWSQQEEVLADTLNHLDGFRLSAYKLHDTADFMQEALESNRLAKETLEVMWETIVKNKQPVMDYLTRKAHLFGKEKLDWQDQDAPVILGDLTEKKYTFDEAAAFIIRHFESFSPKMAAFAQSAFEKSWIEAENRPGKRPGGYCEDLPESKESRIFMTYGESVNEAATLAHELGHAFHSSLMWELPNLNREYAMNVAETASTFAELIVADATLKEAKTPEEKINLLDTKLQNAAAMFMNIHARYLFETRFYTARQSGLVSAEEISVMMLDAQKESYLDQLGSYHPHFWAAKLHFYIDDMPFYNFPYTFGYLFSLSIYAYASQHSGSFEEEYIALLKDTASMTSEALVMKHLGADLTKPEFWQAGISKVLEDIETFMALTEAYV